MVTPRENINKILCENRTKIGVKNEIQLQVMVNIICGSHTIYRAGHELIMTSSNGNFFLRYWLFVRGIHWWPVVSLTNKASDAELWWFLWSVPEQTVNKQSRRRWYETSSPSLWCHCNVKPMLADGSAPTTASDHQQVKWNTMTPSPCSQNYQCLQRHHGRKEVLNMSNPTVCSTACPGEHNTSKLRITGLVWVHVHGNAPLNPLTQRTCNAESVSWCDHFHEVASIIGWL